MATLAGCAAPPAESPPASLDEPACTQSWATVDGPHLTFRLVTGIQADGSLASVRLQGTDVVPTLVVQIVGAAGEACTLLLRLPVGAGTAVGSGVSTRLALAPGGPGAERAVGCTLDPDVWGADPRAQLVGEGLTVEVAGAVGPDATQRLAATVGFPPPGLTPEELLGGEVTLGASLGADAPLEIVGVAGRVVDGEVVLEDGRLVLERRADPSRWPVYVQADVCAPVRFGD